jgi:O-antigen ligase
MKAKLKLKLNSQIALIIFIGAFCIGLFNEGICAVLGVILSVLLLIKLFKERKISLEKSLSTLAVAVISLGFLFVSIWGYDKFNSLLGFVKFLPLLLFWLLLSQSSKEDAENALDTVPFAGAVMTVLSAVLMYIPSLSDYFSVKGRLSGFFQYPSTFALFLIIGIILLAMSEDFSLLKAVNVAILLFGVFLSGSRISFIVFAFCVIALLVFSKNKKMKVLLLVLFGAAVLAAVIYTLVSGNSNAFSRFMTISASSATMKGRLLYYKDAARFILRHPFGIGYMGYYFAQGSFQTGLYSNTFVHGELLQLMLDIGWIPALVLLGSIGRALFSRKTLPFKKLIICAVFIHSMLDFDCQYLVIDFIALLCLYSGENRLELSLPTPAKAAVSAVLCAAVIMSGVLGLSSGLYQLGKSEAAVKVCKYNTMAQLDALNSEQSPERANELADSIINNNPHISNAYSAKALYYYTEGDIAAAIDNKKKAIELNRYFGDEYTDYAVLLVNAYQLYAAQGDEESAAYCAQCLKELYNTIDAVNSSTDKLAFDLPDNPTVALPEEYQNLV